MSDLLRLRPASTTAMMDMFSDAATIAQALSFERALAVAQGEEGLIPAASAAAIATASDQLAIDPSTLADEAAHAGTLAIPLVVRLRAAVPAAVAADVHRGATSQDLADTVLMLQVQGGVALLVADAERATVALDRLARLHVDTPAVSRTLLQDALPIGFGLRFAQWSAGIASATRRLRHETADGVRLQFGGAVGTRAGLGGRGAVIAHRMGVLLGLPYAPPWHARRDGPVAIGAAVGMLVGALGKVARDVSLLTQNTVGELHEPRASGRGGSSAMPHKRNPTGCQVALSAAARAPGLVATLLSAMPQEQERGLGGWQAEAPVLAELLLVAAGAAATIADVCEGLEIESAAIARNLAAAAMGEDIGDSVVIVAELLGRSREND